MAFLDVTFPCSAPVSVSRRSLLAGEASDLSHYGITAKHATLRPGMRPRMAGKARLPAILSQMTLLARLPGRVFSDDSRLPYATLLDFVEIGRAALPEIAEL